MNKISCDICLDLIPLVKDGVASEDSTDAVEIHMAQCESCREVVGERFEEKPKINEDRVFAKLQKQLFGIAIVMILIGVVVGVGLTESAGMFYNILIMPAIGIVGYFALRRRVYYLPSVIFGVVYLWHLIKYAIEGIFEHAGWLSVMVAPVLWALIYSGLSVLGVLIGYLLYIAFKKEGE